MTDDQPDDLTPEEQRVRNLLAEARHTEPLPDDIAARLDAVLADLPAPGPRVSDRPASRPADLAAARRRRTARSLLVAAAAVVLLGFGLQQVTQGDLGASSSSSDSDSAAGGAAPEAADEQPSRTSKPSDRLSDDRGGDADSAESGARSFPRSAVPLTSQRFSRQVRRIQSVGVATSGASEVLPTELDAASGCASAGWGRGRVVAVTYDDEPGALVFRPASGDTQIVDLFLCGEREPTRSITLTAS